jgi:prepilin-type N-terminal cleavage/methylation domain-containing protein
MRKEPAGFTLIELMISVVLGGILFFTVGMIIIYAQVALQKAMRSSGLNDDYRGFQRRMEYEMRGATSKPYYLSTGGYYLVDGTYNADPFINDAGPNSVLFYTVDRSIAAPARKIKVHRVYEDSTNHTIVYKFWYARTTPGSPPHIWLQEGQKDGTLPSRTDTVLRDLRELQALLFTLSGAKTEVVRVDTVQKKVIHQGSGAAKTEMRSFTVKTRHMKPN